MKTTIGISVFDKRPSVHLDDRPYNTGLVAGMRDELRKINDSLFIGMGYMPIGGGSINPGPFLVFAPPSPWVAPIE